MDTSKRQIKTAAFALAFVTLISGAFAFAPGTTIESEEEQIVLTGEFKLEQKLRFCSEKCPALLSNNGYEIFVEYGLDGASIRYMEPMSVSKNGIEVNAYIDSNDIQNINAAILGNK